MSAVTGKEAAAAATATAAAVCWVAAGGLSNNYKTQENNSKLSVLRSAEAAFQDSKTHSETVFRLCR
jgi:hypothetical protein